MGSPSMSTHRGPVHWQGLLLVVSLLNFWSQPTTAQVKVQSMTALEGTDVLLRISNKPDNAAGFLWYNGAVIDSNHNIAYLLENPRINIRGPTDGQAIVDDNGQLLLKNVTVKHSGIYTLVVELPGCQEMIAHGWLDVYPYMSVPTLLASNTTVTENKDAVVFTCNTNTLAIEWFFNGTSLMLTERMKLSRDRRNLTIDPVQRQDAGDYQCKAFNPVDSAISVSLALDVKFE